MTILQHWETAQLYLNQTHELPDYFLNMCISRTLDANALSAKKFDGQLNLEMVPTRASQYLLAY